MRENPQARSASIGVGPSVAMGFVLGALVGAGVALLLAPKSGRETRRDLADAGRRWQGAARSKLDQARDTARDLKKVAGSALEAGREAFEQSRKSQEPRPALPIDMKG